MRQNILIVTLLLIIQSAFSQIVKKEDKITLTDTARSVSIDPICFLLGTLSDSMWQYRGVDREN